MNVIYPKPPIYQGRPQQPKNGGGLLSQLLCYVFGGGTPAYQGNGQQAPRGCGFSVFPGTPAYKTPPIVTTDPTDPSEPTDGEGVYVAPCDESGANGSPQASDPIEMTGPVTIVIG